MKITTNFNKEDDMFALPIIGIAYQHKAKELAFVFVFACWCFSITLYF